MGLVLRISDGGGEVVAPTPEELLVSLPDTFRYSEALEHISERQLRRLIDGGSIIPLSRGLYRKSDWLGDEDLIEIAAKAHHATLCLRSALARHELIDDIPGEIDIAIPRGSWTPETRAPVRWRHFDPDTFEIGRDQLDIGGGRSIGIYSAERSIIDTFRMRHLAGADLANEALKRWLRRGGQPSELLQMARSFPRALTALRETMEILL
jgi:predicted transcriptional regulator of viral defense system